MTGHIAGHETGAIEATGHKVLTLPSDDGKITARQVKELYDAHWNDATHEHMGAARFGLHISPYREWEDLQ